MDRIERLAHLSLVLLGLIALFAALREASSIFAPLALALVAGLVLSPVSDFWERRGFPAVFGALLSLAATLVLLGCLVLALQPVVAQLVEQAPKVWADLRGTVKLIQSVFVGLSEISDDVSSAIAPDANAAPTGQSNSGMDLPTVTDALLLAPAIAGQILVFAGALFFFLLTRNEIYTWVARHMAQPMERVNMARKLRDAERRVSHYFLTITAINAGLGVSTAVVMQIIGLPGAMLWGLVAFLLNFILYLGPAIVAFSLLFAGVASFDGGMSFLPAAAYVGMNATEGQFVTPSLVGRNLSVNPLLVFVSLVFGLWLWGPIGGIVAIPLLLWVLVLNDGLKFGHGDHVEADAAR